MRAATLRDHNTQLRRALEVVREHLDEPIPLRRLARLSGFSERHFARLFAARTGESPQHYIRRLRLNRAARQLRATKRSVLSIALDSGFASHEVFTRAFRTRFGGSPSAYRQAPTAPGAVNGRRERLMILFAGRLRAQAEGRRLN